MNSTAPSNPAEIGVLDGFSKASPEQLRNAIRRLMAERDDAKAEGVWLRSQVAGAVRQRDAARSALTAAAACDHDDESGYIGRCNQCDLLGEK
jgi:hypothetical protein